MIKHYTSFEEWVTLIEEPHINLLKGKLVELLGINYEKLSDDIVKNISYTSLEIIEMIENKDTIQKALVKRIEKLYGKKLIPKFLPICMKNKDVLSGMRKILKNTKKIPPEKVKEKIDTLLRDTINNEFYKSILGQRIMDKYKIKITSEETYELIEECPNIKNALIKYEKEKTKESRNNLDSEIDYEMIGIHTKTKDDPPEDYKEYIKRRNLFIQNNN